MISHDGVSIKQRCSILWAYSVVLALAAGAAGCEKKQKKPTRAEICNKGCAYRLACIEDLALDKAVTDANRDHLRREQEKNRKKYLAFCVKACRAGKPRFQAYARCGARAKNCSIYFKCESAAIGRLKGMSMD